MKRQEYEFAAMEWLLPHIGSSRRTTSNLLRPMMSTNLQVVTPPDSLGFCDEIESLEDEQLQLNDDEAPDKSTTNHSLLHETEVIGDNNQDEQYETNNMKKKKTVE